MNEENMTPEQGPERISSKYLDFANKHNLNDAELSEYLEYQDLDENEYNSIIQEHNLRRQDQAKLDNQMLEAKIGMINTEIEQLERQPEEATPEEDTGESKVGVARGFGAGLLQLTGEIDYFATEILGLKNSILMQGPLGMLPADVRLQMVKDEANDIREGMRTIEGDLIENLNPFDDKGNLIDGLELAVTSIVESLPAMGVIAATGGTGVALIGGAKGMSAYHDVKYRTDMTEEEKFAYSLASGGIEALSERVSAGIAGKAFKGAKSSIKNNLLSRQFSRGFLKSAGLGASEEAGAEFSAGFLQSLNEQYFLSDSEIDYKSAIRTGINGAIVGFLGGAGFGGAGYAMGAMSVNAAQKASALVDKEMSDLEAQRNDILRQLDQTTDSNERQALNSLLTDFESTRSRRMSEKSERYRVMRRRNPEALADLTVKAAQIESARARYEAAKTDSARKVIKENLDGLVNQFREIDSNALPSDAKLTVTEKYQDAIDDINIAIRESESDMEAIADMEPQNDGDLIAIQGVMDRISSLKNKKKALMKAAGDVEGAMRENDEIKAAKAEAKLQEIIEETLPSDVNNLTNKRQVEDDLGQDSSTDTFIPEADPEPNEIEFDTITADSKQLLGDDFAEATKDTEVNFGIKGIINNLLSSFNRAGLSVIIHKTRDSYNRARGEGAEGSNAFYDKGSKTIHLSPTVTPSIVRHEFLHGALRSVFDNDTTRKRLFNEVRKIAQSDPQARELYNIIVRAYTERNVTGKTLEEEVVVGFMEKLLEPSVYEQYQSKTIIEKIINVINRIFGSKFGIPSEMAITNVSELRDIVKAFKFAEDTGSRVDVQGIADQVSDGRVDSVSKAHPELVDKEVSYIVRTPANNSLGYVENYKTVRIRDYFHWRNFWATMTGNGKNNWIFHATYEVEGGRKLIKTPSPKRDRRTGEVLDMEPKLRTYSYYRNQKATREREARIRQRKEEAQIIGSRYHLRQEGIEIDELELEDMLFVEDRLFINGDNKLDNLNIEGISPIKGLKGSINFFMNTDDKLHFKSLGDFDGVPRSNIPYDSTAPKEDVIRKEDFTSGIGGVAHPTDKNKRVVASFTDKKLALTTMQDLAAAEKIGHKEFLITQSSMAEDAVLSNPDIFEAYFYQFEKNIIDFIKGSEFYRQWPQEIISTRDMISRSLGNHVNEFVLSALKGDKAAEYAIRLQDLESFDVETLTLDGSKPMDVWAALQALSSNEVTGFDQRRAFLKKTFSGKEDGFLNRYNKENNIGVDEVERQINNILPKKKEIVDRFTQEEFMNMPPEAIVGGKVISLSKNYSIENIGGSFPWAIVVPKSDLQVISFKEIYNFADVYASYKFKDEEKFGGKTVGDLFKTDNKSQSISSLRRSIVTILDSLVDTSNLTLDQFNPREQSNLESIMTRFKVKLQDRFAKVMMLQEDIEKFRGEAVSESRDFKASEELMHGKTKEDLDKLEAKVKGIADDMNAAQIKSDDVSQYIYAKHAKERNRLILERSEGKIEDGSGMSDQDADNILSSYSGDKKAKMEAIASKVQEIVADTRKTYVEMGLESQSTVDAFESMFDNYVPLSGLATDELDAETSFYPTGGGGIAIYGSSTKKARGRQTQAQNILAQVIAQNAQAKVRGRKNEALNTLYNLVTDNPNSKVWRITDSVKYDSEHAVGVRVNGEQKYIVFRDASMAKSLKNMGVEKLDVFSKIMRVPATWLRRSFTTVNPEFIISNFARDIQSSVFNALAEADIEGGMISGKDVALNMIGTVKQTLPALAKAAIGRPMDPDMQRYYDEFREDGGQTGWAHVKPVTEIAAEIEAMTSEQSKAKKASEWMAKNSIEFIENINDAFENSIRLAAYIETRKAGGSRTKAAQLAKNITVNFNKHGELGPVANAWFLFFNASIQGTARLGRSLLSLKPAYVPFGGKRSGLQRLNSAQKMAIGLSGLAGMLAMINIGMSDEDKDGELFYNKIPDYEKERNLILMYDGKHYIKIPLPYGFNIFANIGTALTEVSTGNREVVDAMMFTAMSFMSSFSPISFGQSKDMVNYLGKAVIPTVFKPVVEVMTNETYFGGSVYREQFPVGAKKPESELGFKSPKNVQEFFKWMNEATGGNEFESGWMDSNPDKFWHIFDYYLGGAGQFVNRTGEFIHGMGASIATGEKIPMEANDIPFLRKLYGDPSKYYDYQLYTDRKEEIQQLYQTVRKGEYEKGDPKYKGVGGLDKRIKEVEKRLKIIRDKRKKVYDLPYAQRQAQLAELFEKERELVMAFNKYYDDTRGE